MGDEKNDNDDKAGASSGTIPPGTDTDNTRTPGDGTLTNAVPAGLTADELEKLANTPDLPSDTGTG